MNILIVDDVAINLSLLRAQLEAEGHVVTSASNGVNALQVLERGGVDVIISDVLMPEMDGHRLCSEVRRNERHQHLPFIFLAATYGSPADEQLAIDLGADAYLRKPASVHDLRAAIETAAVSTRRRPTASGAGTGVLRVYNEDLVIGLQEKSIAIADRYRNVVETIGDGIWTFDENHCTTFVNTRMAEMLGCRVDEMQGRPIFEFVKEEAIPAATSLLDAPRRGIREQHDFEFLRKDGTPLWTIVSTSPLTDGAGNSSGVLAVTDITQRVAIEQALRESEAALAEAQQLAHIGSWILYPESGEVRASAETFRMFAIDPRPVAPLHLFVERVHEDDRARMKAEIDASRLTGRQDFEYRIVTPQGTRSIHALVRLHEVGEAHPSLIGTIQDITERKAAEESLRQQTESLQRSNAELERFNRLAVGRELRMIELKQQINDLCAQLGQPARYVLPEESVRALETS